MDSVFLYGCISGMVGVTLSHPLDTMKTKLQNKLPIDYKIRSLYRGFLPPLISVGIEKALVFGTYKYFHSRMQYYTSSENIKNLVSGCAAGGVAALIVTPFEKIKIYLQSNSSQINFKKNFSFHDIYKGLGATFTREIPGFGIYFTCYQYLKKNIYKNEITTMGSFCIGGLSGMISWIFIYPQDTIKTKIQSCSKTSYKDIFDNIKIKDLYRGFHYALLRAIPLHAGTFFTMEFLLKGSL